MAKVLNNFEGRNTIRLSADDVISVVREYQNIIFRAKNEQEIRDILEHYNFYLPEDI